MRERKENRERRGRRSGRRKGRRLGCVKERKEKRQECVYKLRGNYYE